MYRAIADIPTRRELNSHDVNQILPAHDLPFVSCNMYDGEGDGMSQQYKAND